MPSCLSLTSQVAHLPFFLYYYYYISTDCGDSLTAKTVESLIYEFVVTADKVCHSVWHLMSMRRQIYM